MLNETFCKRAGAPNHAPNSERGGPPQATPAFQFPTFSTSENVIKLQELFNFCRNTALAVASLAFAGGRR
jgi:hypothetical protein